MAQVLCPGCDKPIALNGLLRHLRNTQNERCRAVRHPSHAPGAIHGTASSLASIPTAHTFFSAEDFLDLGANQRPRDEMDLPMHTQEGKLTATRVSGRTWLLKITTFSGLNVPFFGDIRPYADAMDTEIAEIEPNVMQAITCDASQGDATEADRPQGDMIEANTIYTDAIIEDSYDAPDNSVTSQVNLLDGGASESSSQGKNLQLHRNMSY